MLLYAFILSSRGIPQDSVFTPLEMGIAVPNSIKNQMRLLGVTNSFKSLIDCQ